MRHTERRLPFEGCVCVFVMPRKTVRETGARGARLVQNLSQYEYLYITVTVYCMMKLLFLLEIQWEFNSSYLVICLIVQLKNTLIIKCFIIIIWLFV